MCRVFFQESLGGVCMLKKLLASCVVMGLMVSPVLAAENAQPAPAKKEVKEVKKATVKKAAVKKATVKKEAPKKAEKTEKK